jgi:FkbM family methyltransferase
VGSFTRKALEKGASFVIAIEPSAQKVAYLHKNFAQEIAQSRVRVLQVGVWSGDGKFWLGGISDVGNSIVSSPTLPGEGWGEWVRVTTVDQIVEEQQLGKVDFIKMDAEGSECEALKGTRGTIVKFKPFLAIGTEHTGDLQKNARTVIQIVRESGVKYKLRFGRYGHLGNAGPYSPMEVFFLP